MRNFLIRYGHQSDAVTLSNIEESSFDRSKYGNLITTRQFRHLLQSDTASIGVAENYYGEVNGYALLLFRKNTTSSRFYSLAVTPPAHKLGIGRALFDWAEEETLRQGRKQLLLEIREDNEVLLRRYSQRGYSEYRRVPLYYPDGSAAIKMSKNFVIENEMIWN